MVGGRAIKAGQAFVEILAENKTGKGLAIASAQLSNFARQIKDIGKQMILGGGMITAPSFLSLKSFASYDDIMRQVEARTTGTVKQMEDLRTQARKLGLAMSFTSTQVGELQVKLGQRGFNRLEIKDMTQDILELARATGDLTDPSAAPMAADLVSQIMKEFEIPSTGVRRVVDVMTAAINNTNLTMDTMITAMTTAGVTSHAFKLSLEETVSMVGALRDVNLDATTAGTGLRNMLVKLSSKKETDKFVESVKEMTGVTLKMTDAQGNLRSLPKIMEEIGNATKGMGTAEKGNVLAELFGLRALVPSMVLSGKMEEFNKILEIVQNSANMTTETVKLMEGGIGGAFRRIVSGFQDVKIAVGEALSPIADQWNPKIERFILDVIEYIKRNEKMVQGIAVFGAKLLAAGGGVMALGIALKGLSVTIMAISKMFTMGIPFAMLLAGPVGVYAIGNAIKDLDGIWGQVGQNIVQSTTKMKDGIVANFMHIQGAFMTLVSEGKFEESFKLLTDALTVHWESFTLNMQRLFQEANMGFIRDLSDTMNGISSTWAKGFLVLQGQVGRIHLNARLGMVRMQMNKAQEEYEKRRNNVMSLQRMGVSTKEVTDERLAAIEENWQKWKQTKLPVLLKQQAEIQQKIADSMKGVTQGMDTVDDFFDQKKEDALAPYKEGLDALYEKLNANKKAVADLNKEMMNIWNRPKPAVLDKEALQQQLRNWQGLWNDMTKVQNPLPQLMEMIQSWGALVKAPSMSGRVSGKLAPGDERGTVAAAKAIAESQATMQEYYGKKTEDIGMQIKNELTDFKDKILDLLEGFGIDLG